MFEYVYDLLGRKESEKPKPSCDFCSKDVCFNVSGSYTFKILGSDKHNNKLICYYCMKQKFENKSENRNRKKILVMN